MASTEVLLLRATQTQPFLFYLDMLKGALSELANLQETGYWKYFRFWNIGLHCNLGKRYRTIMSCEAELQCLPKFTVFLNVSGMDASPN